MNPRELVEDLQAALSKMNANLEKIASDVEEIKQKITDK